MNRSATNGRSGLENLLEEFAGRLEAGEAVDVEAFAAEHPEYVEQLRRVLPTMLVLADLGRSASASGAAPPTGGDSEPTTGVLGDFRIVCEVGRGGMGIVYEAEQVSLGRRVALKVLPFAGALDGRQLQRFQNEARAAACLHHTNIVPVFGVGCDRGVHFYAMQFIDGRPLSDAIRDLRQPATAVAPASPVPGEAIAAYVLAKGVGGTTDLAARQATLKTASGRRGREYFRRVAELGVQAAEALDHAHQAGIVHRDVKPGNLLLDGLGRLWVTDFGLAHVAHGEASLTATGDMVGTLRYMSPEQALAKRVPIDHRTDVYSLGASLYELLTLEPAFPGTDRQEVLRQIAFEEPQAPRRTDKTIPAELETIILKAMEKNPTERFGTAQEMADDLRRWLDDKPIRARRPSWRQVAAKWARRHQAVVWATAVVLLVVGGFGVWRLQQRAAAEAEAETALKDSGDLQTQEKYPEALFTIGRAEPLLKTGLLGQGLRRRVRERLEDLKMVDKLGQIYLDTASGKDGLMDTALADPAYEQAFRDFGIDVLTLGAEEVVGRMLSRSIRVELAAALDDWAFVSRQTRDKGAFTWKDLLALARAADPDEMRNRLRDAVERGDVQTLKGLATPGVADKLPPSTLVLLTRGLWGHIPGEQAVAVLREGQRRHPGNFWINFGLAYTLENLGPAHLEEALRYYTAAVAVRPLCVETHHNLGAALERKGQLEEAIAEYREAIRLKKDYPLAHYGLGNALSDKGQVDAAIAEYREAIRLRKDDDLAHGALGNALKAKGQLDEAIAEYREAIRLRKDNDLTHSNLGIALKDTGRLDEAIAEFREAVRLKKGDPSHHQNLGSALMINGQFRKAVEELRLGHQLGSLIPGWTDSISPALRQAEQLADLDNRLPQFLKGGLQPISTDERVQLAFLCLHPCKQFYTAAVRWYSEAFAADRGMAADLQEAHLYNAACAAALAGCGQGKDASTLSEAERGRFRRQALDWLREDLTALRRVLEKEPDKALGILKMRPWQQDKDFAGVRGPEALARLPEAERQAWREFWGEVEKTLDRAQSKAATKEGGRKEPPTRR